MHTCFFTVPHLPLLSIVKLHFFSHFGQNLFFETETWYDCAHKRRSPFFGTIFFKKNIISNLTGKRITMLYELRKKNTFYS